VPIVRAADLVALAGRLRARGLRLVVASEKANATLRDQNFAGACAVIVGNEGCGVHPALIEKSDAQVRIPQVGRIGSLNAAVAAAIFFYEARRQRD
jgi:23S rRNA (guanosine2251-2'-O)-methyltransferase